MSGRIVNPCAMVLHRITAKAITISSPRYGVSGVASTMPTETPPRIPAQVRLAAEHFEVAARDERERLAQQIESGKQGRG